MLVALVELTTILVRQTDGGERLFTKDQIFTLFCYMIITKEQETLVIEDPNQFIEDEDKDFTEKNLKDWICELKEELIDEYSLTLSILQTKNMLLETRNPLLDEIENEEIKELFHLKLCEIGFYLIGDLAEEGWKVQYSQVFELDSTITDIIIPTLKQIHECKFIQIIFKHIYK